ncbi:hypothetical protein HZA56_14120 [Candidatus Poribacteria bacterium]|nr:hypothetical protein [Candidatus Poribacteria bacterium]
MTIEKEMELRAEYMNCRDDLMWCMIIMLASGLCFLFCGIKGFIPGVIVALIIQFVAMARGQKAQDRMKEVQWEHDRG